MTKLKTAVTRMSEATVRDGGKRRRLVITIYPGSDPMIGLRPEKTRGEETISLDAVYALAVRQRVNQEAREKKALRKSKGGRR